MEGILLREAKLADLPIIEEFQRKSIKESRKILNHFIDKKEDAQFYTTKDLKQIIRSSSGVYVIAEHVGKAVGTGFARIESVYGSWCKYQKRGYLGQLYVDLAYRHKGIATKIMDYRIKWLKKHGVKLIMLRSYSGNIKAIEFFKKYGFKDHAVEMTFG